jgi:hypothetical protein
MKKIVYLIGGTGNIFFQLKKAYESSVDFVASDIFIKASVRRIFNQTNHNNIQNEIFLIKTVLLKLPQLLLLSIDLLLAKLFGFALFTTIDIRNISATPLVYSYIFFGYFQEEVSLGSIQGVKNIIKPYFCKDYQELDNVIHIRGGDFLDVNWSLDFEYYRKAVQEFIEEGEGDFFTVVTNDIGYSQQLMDDIKMDIQFKILKNDEKTDFRIMNSCKNMICSNSTFALTSALTGKNIRKITLPKVLMNKFRNESDMHNVKISVL